MTKAGWLFENNLLNSFFYKDMDIFYVKYPNNKIEKNYFKLNEKGEVLVFTKEEDKLKNPVIKGTGLNYDSKNKRNIYRWDWGSSFAYPLFAEEHTTKPLITEEDTNQIFDAGAEWQKLQTPQKENDALKNVNTFLLICMGLGAVNAFLAYKIADHFGLLANLLSFGGG